MIISLATTDILNNKIPKFFFDDSEHSCYVLHLGSLLGLFFSLEDGGDMFV
jgi:hypothetical protein